MSKRDSSFEDATWQAPRSFRKGGPDLLERVRKSERISKKIEDSADESGMSADERTDEMEEMTGAKQSSPQRLGDGMMGRQRFIASSAQAGGATGPAVFTHIPNPWDGRLSGSVSIDRAIATGHGDVLSRETDLENITFDETVTRTTSQLLNRGQEDAILGGTGDTVVIGSRQRESDEDDVRSNAPLADYQQHQRIVHHQRRRRADDDESRDSLSHSFRGRSVTLEEQIRALEERARVIEMERMQERTSASRLNRELTSQLDDTRKEVNTSQRREITMRAAMDQTSRVNVSLQRALKADTADKAQLTGALAKERTYGRSLKQRVRLAEDLLSEKNREQLGELLATALQTPGVKPEAAEGGLTGAGLISGDTTLRKVGVDDFYTDDSSDSDGQEAIAAAALKVKAIVKTDDKTEVKTVALSAAKSTVHAMTDVKHSFRLPKVPEFNGLNFEGFMYKFDAQCKQLGWDDTTAVFNLQQSMTGKAMSVLLSNNGQQWTLSELRAALLARYGINKSATTVMNEMSVARREPTETLQDFADRIVDMSLKAEISDARRANLTRAAFVQGLRENTELQHYIERHDRDKTSLQRAVSVAFKYERQHGVSKGTSRFENVVGETAEEIDAFQGQQAGKVWRKPYGTDWSKPAAAVAGAPAEPGLAKLLSEMHTMLNTNLTTVTSALMAIKDTSEATKKVVDDDVGARKQHWSRVKTNKKQNKFNAMEAKKASAALPDPVPKPKKE